MKKTLNTAAGFLKKADTLLLVLCCAATIFGIVAISSATAYTHTSNYVTKQIAALILGIIVYIIFTLIDIDIIAEQGRLLYVLSLVFIAMLFIWGKSDNTGNRAWLFIPYVGISVQPAEVCKIIFIIVLAKSMSVRRDKISAPSTVILLAAELCAIVLVIVAASSDAGSAIVYLAIFIFMAFAAGINFGWILGGFAAICAVAPILWTKIMREDQKQRILVLFDPTIDPLGHDIRYQMLKTQTALGGGQMFGQGYGKGTLTSTGSIPAQHNDCIFAAIGEEMGYVGCIAVLLILAVIVIRCIYVAVKANKFSNRLICIGIASMLMFQIVINVGMNLGVLPVIGLTLPFISYGGTSIVTTFAAMGIVSGIKMRPESDAAVRYIRPPLTVR